MCTCCVSVTLPCKSVCEGIHINGTHLLLKLKTPNLSMVNINDESHLALIYTVQNKSNIFKAPYL